MRWPITSRSVVRSTSLCSPSPRRGGARGRGDRAGDRGIVQEPARAFSGIGQFAPDANFYSGKGVLPSLLLLPLLRVSLLVGADPVVAALTLSAVCTVLTACVIARFVRCELGSARAAFLSGALYILGTMALAYSKRLFTEPAAALCVALAFTWLASSARTNYVHLVVAGLAFGGAIAAEYAGANPRRVSHLILIATAGEYQLNALYRCLASSCW